MAPPLRPPHHHPARPRSPAPRSARPATRSRSPSRSRSRSSSYDSQSRSCSRSRLRGRDYTPSRSQSQSQSRSRSRPPAPGSRYRSRYHSRSWSRSPSRRRRQRSYSRDSRDSRGSSRGSSDSRDSGDSRNLSPDDGGSTIVIEGLSKHINREHLFEIFGEYGRILEVDLLMNKQSNTNRGTAFIVYDLEDDADAAIDSMHDACIDGDDRLGVSLAPHRPRTTRQPPSPPKSSRPVPRRNGSRTGSRRGASPPRAALPPQEAMFSARGGKSGRFNHAGRRSRSRSWSRDAADRDRDRARSRSPGRHKTRRFGGDRDYDNGRGRPPPSPPYDQRRRGGRPSFDNMNWDKGRGRDRLRSRSPGAERASFRDSGRAQPPIAAFRGQNYA